MMETFILLLTAHLLGDFVLQTRWMVQNKRRWWILGLHAILVGGVTIVLLGGFHPIIIPGVLVSHVLLDGIKVLADRDDAWAFVWDQAGHLAVLVGLAAIFPEAATEGWWAYLSGCGGWQGWFYAGLCLVSGVVLIAPVGGILIEKLTEPFSRELRAEGSQAPLQPEANHVEGLRHGGRYIGWLERLLTLLLLLLNLPGGIGFVIAAKSILRFGEIKESSQRKMAEYIIIGTFMSFGWALLIGSAVKAGIAFWAPIAAGG